MDCKEIQIAELEAVRAIFMDDYAEVESRAVWKSVTAVPEFTVKTYSMEEDLRDSVSAVLHFKLPKTYPKVVPQVAVVKGQGLSPSQLDGLNEQLQSTAKGLVGSEMVYELATTASAYMTDNNSVVRFSNITSLSEDKAKREVEAEQIAAKEQEKDKARREIERLERLQAEIDADNVRRARLREDRLKEVDPPVNGNMADSAELAAIDRFSTPLKLPGNLKATVVVRGSVLAQTPVYTMYHAEAVVSSRHGIRLPVTLCIVDVYSPFYLTTAGHKKLEKFVDDTGDLVEISHNNLVAIYGAQKSRLQDTVSQGWRLSVVTEALPNSTLLDLVHNAGELRLQKALPFLRDISAALECLHAAHLAHRSVDLSHIRIGRTDAGEKVVKVAEGVWMSLLMDLNRSNRFLETEVAVKPEAWKYPALHANPLAIDKAQDLWDFGVLLVQVLYGADALQRYSSPPAILAETRSTMLGRLLTSLFDIKPISAARLQERLAEFEGEAEKSSTSLHTISTATESLPALALQNVFSPPNQNFMEEQAGLFWQPRQAVASRYRSEFEEVEKLGQGGFGQVVKARNRLDNNFYAIKKVKLPTDTTLESKILREVTIWGRLSHPGIVRYHTSWLETEGSTSTDVRQALGMLNSASGTTSDEDDSDEESLLTDTTSNSETASEGNEEDFDLGFDDLDFISTGHQSRSLSMPTIHFGNEDDPSTEASRVNTRHATPDIGPDSPAPQLLPRQNRTLFIQMEYVSGQTLREVSGMSYSSKPGLIRQLQQIDDGISEETMWRILRQILNAMRYYTSFSIIHRDLKPANILIDGSGSVRIADFGLAVEQSNTDHLPSVPSVSADKDSDFTSGVGTSLYVAPETLERRKATDRSSRFTDKIDMFSLGIIIFEMCWPMKTRMERIDTLKALRRPEIHFPTDWDESDPNRIRQGRLIRWCLSHDPSKRVGPLELLRSDLLPAAVQDEYISDTLALLSRANSPHIQTILTALFQNKSEDRRALDLAFDIDGEDSELNSPYDSSVKQKLSELFAVRGAVELNPPLLMPASDVYDEKLRRPVKLLNRQGTNVELPYDLVLPLARFVARDDNITRLKRWSIAPVYREDRMGGQPKAFWAASYDLISSHATLAAEAECLQTVDEVLTDICDDDDFVHVIGHADFLSSFVDSLPLGKRILAKRALERYELLSSPWSQVIGEMVKLGLSRKSLDDLAALDLCEDVRHVEARIKSLSSITASQMRSAMQDVKQVVKLCHDMGITRPIVVSPLLCFKHELHLGGVCFQTRLRKGKRRDVFAEGGRYDKLVESLAMPGTRQTERTLVGVQLAVSKLSRTMAARTSNSTAKSTISDKVPRRCEVFIVSYSTGLLEPRLLIARDLWKQHISADLMYDDDFAKLGPDRIAATARKEGIRYLVIVKGSNSSREAPLKVKDLTSNAEREVYRPDLPSFLSDKLGDPLPTPHFERTPSFNHHLPSVNALDSHLSMQADVLKKMKHKQKQIVLDKAADSVAETLSAAGDIPLFAVEAEGEAFRLMSESANWIHRDDTGQAVRRILEAAPASRKSYILDLRDELKAYHARTKCRWLWLYSLKDTKSNLVSFV